MNGARAAVAEHESPLLKALWWAAALFFPVYYLWLNAYNRPAGDDLVFLANLKEKGWLDAVVEFPYNIRWGSFLLYNVVFTGADGMEVIVQRQWLFHAGLLVYGIGGMWWLMRCAGQRMGVRSPWHVDLRLALVLIGVLFHLTVQYGEVWFWTIGAAVYLFPVFSACWALGFVLHSGSLFLGLAGAFVFSVLATGGLETWGLWWGVFLLILGWTRFRKAGIKGLEAPLMAGLAGFVAMEVINLLSGQHGARAALESSEHALAESLNPAHYTVLAELKRLLKAVLQPHNAVGLLLLVALAARAPAWLREIAESIKPRAYLMAAIGTLVIAFGPLLVVFGNLGPERGWSVVSTVWSGLALLAFIQYATPRMALVHRPVAIACLLVAATGIGAFLGYRSLTFGRSHAMAYDARVDFLQKSADTGPECTEVPLLPDPGTLISGELSPLPYHAYNESFQKLLKLDGCITVKSIKE
jgi:hypothetical protein